jgi:hypothetical protein
MAKLYVCRNAGCPLGTLGSPGRFAGGMSKETKHLLTGAPLDELRSGEDYGPGICPNCGSAGEEFDAEDARREALAEAEAQHAERLRAIEGGVA